MNYYDYFVSQENIETIHAMTLRILEKVGIRFEAERALQALKARGAKIDGNVAYLPRNLVEEALSTVPDSFTMHSKGQQTTVGGSSMVKLPWGLSVYTNDGGEVRLLRNQDMVEFFKLQDTSPVVDAHINFNFYDTEGWSPQQKKFGHTAFALKYANKPTYVSGEYHDVEDFYECIELIQRFNGLDDGYVTMMRMNSLSPLTLDKMGLQYLFAAADKNQPLMIAPCAMAAMTAPPTVAGLLAVTNAEILGGLTLSQVLRPGLPFLYGNTSTSADLRTVQLTMGAPEAALIVYATVALGRYYNMPCRAGGALTDAKDVDWQAGAESTMMMNATIMAAPDLVFHTCGLLGTMNIASFEKFILDEENLLMCARVRKGIDFSPEKMSFEMIKRVGPRGSFLEETSSSEFHKDFFFFQNYDKDDINQWKSKGSVCLKTRVGEVAQKRVESYAQPVISTEQQALLEKYLPTAYLNET